MKIHRWDKTGRDVTDSPSDWSADDVEICQTNYPHPSITSGQHTNGPEMIWIRRDGRDWVRTGETHMHKVRASLLPDISQDDIAGRLDQCRVENHELRTEVDRLNGIIDRMCAAHRPTRKDGE